MFKDNYERAKAIISKWPSWKSGYTLTKFSKPEEKEKIQVTHWVPLDREGAVTLYVKYPGFCGTYFFNWSVSEEEGLDYGLWKNESNLKNAPDIDLYTVENYVRLEIALPTHEGTVSLKDRFTGKFIYQD